MNPKIPLLLAALLAPSLASADAGKLLFTLGRVEIQRNGAVIPAARGMAVAAGDRLDLGATGRTQIRMSDGAMIALQPGSSFVIEEYQLPAPAPAASSATIPTPTLTPVRAVAGSGSGRALFSLLRGGFRTITGLIGKGDGDTYQLKTPVATIGIRGTTFSATYCNGNCGSAPKGLYVGVSSGGVVVTNKTGTLPLGDSRYGYVSDENAPPEQQIRQPDGVAETPIAGGRGGDGGGPPRGVGGGPPTAASNSSSSQSASLEVPGGKPNAVAQPTRLVAHSTGPLLGTNAFAGASVDDSQNLALSSTGGLLAFRSSIPGGGIADYSLGSAQVVNPGRDPVSDLRWGRWSGGTANVGRNALNLSNQSLHWIYGPETLQQPALPITGTASYSLVGNTDPTDNLGHIGVLGNASFSANFSAGTVSSSLDLLINNQVWNAGGSGNIVSGFPAFGGSYGSVRAGPAADGTGSFAGFFVGPSGGTPTGAGLSYSLSNGSTSVSGAAAFGNPASGGAP